MKSNFNWFQFFFLIMLEITAALGCENGTSAKLESAIFSEPFVLLCSKFKNKLFLVISRCSEKIKKILEVGWHFQKKNNWMILYGMTLWWVGKKFKLYLKTRNMYIFKLICKIQKKKNLPDSMCSSKINKKRKTKI